MVSLRRTRSACFSISQACTLRELEERKAKGSLAEVLIPVDRVFAACPALHTKPEYDKQLRNGAKLAPDSWQQAPDSLQKSPDFRRQVPDSLQKSSDFRWKSQGENNEKEENSIRTDVRPKELRAGNGFSPDGDSAYDQSGGRKAAYDGDGFTPDPSWRRACDSQGIFRGIYRLDDEGGLYRPVKMFL